MADHPRPTVEALPRPDRADVEDGGAAVGARAAEHLGDGGGESLHETLHETLPETLQVLEERLAVSKRRRRTGVVRVGTRTETVAATAEVELERYAVEVTRVPVGRAVDEAPAARAEGDTTVIPVVEERLVVVKQLFLVEEIHVRHVLRRETVTEAVTLRRQRAVVERGDARDGDARDGEPGLDREIPTSG